MLRGVSGCLVSHDYAEHGLAAIFQGRLGEATRPAACRALARWWHDDGRYLGPAASLRVLFDRGASPVLSVLGFAARQPRLLRPDEALVAEASCGSATLPVVVTAWGAPMDHVWADVAREGSRLAADWAFCFNGQALRLADARHIHARAWLDFDLEQLGDAEPAQILWWGLLRAEALAAITREVVDVSARHGVMVAASLREGVHDALATLLQGLLLSRARRAKAMPDTSELEASLDEALTVVYRVLFLLFAESRALVPMWHPTYRRSYTVESLRSRVERPGHSRGVWESLQALSRLAHAGCRAGTLRVTPFNGRLFAPARAPRAETRRLDDRLVARALLSLTTHAAGGRRERIAFRDLGVEQLGAIYESVLEYEPAITFVSAEASTRRRPPAVGSRAKLIDGGGARKTSGTFYTPQAITSHVVAHALRPLVDGAGPEDILRLRVLDPAMGSGAFIVAACRYLASAYEAATVRERGLFPSEISDSDRAGYRRLVAQRCLYGVDSNPMAVQVARLSMWLTTLAEDRPLSFLDHRMVTGNSLVGASLDDLARQPPGGRTGRQLGAGLPLFGDEMAGAALRAALPVRVQLAEAPDDTADIVHGKERMLAQLNAETAAMSRLKRAADLWCACWFWGDQGTPAPTPAEYGALVDAIRGHASALPPKAVEPRLATAQRLADRHRFFHWTLEFPEVFFDADGSPSVRAGFDAVLGNPPWEMLRGDTGSSDARSARRLEAHGLTQFARQSGIYLACRDGHVNQYQLFVERSLALLRPGGRLGLVLPWGLASDHGSAGLRRLLFDHSDVDAIVGFENTAGIFPIHRGVRFLLLSASAGRPTTRIRCRLGERDPGALDSMQMTGGESPGIRLTPELLQRVSGTGLAIPYLRTRRELDLLERMTTTWPPLGDARGWAARFGRELNATEDSHRFSSARGELPIIEGKHLDMFRVRVSASKRWVRRSADLPSAALVKAVRHPRLAYRDVASATNRTTLIAAVVPAGVVTVHTVFCLKTPLRADDQWFLCGMLNSLAANFLVRLWVTTHLGSATVERLPVPRPPEGSADMARIRALSRQLSEGDDDPETVAEVQARACGLYGITRDELPIVLEAFPLVDAALKAGIVEHARRLEVLSGRV